MGELRMMMTYAQAMMVLANSSQYPFAVVRLAIQTVSTYGLRRPI